MSYVRKTLVVTHKQHYDPLARYLDLCRRGQRAGLGPWGRHMMWGSWGIGMMLMMFLFWAALIVAVVYFIRWLITAGDQRQQAVTGHGTESALDILQKRYARGEISKAEFQGMRQELQEKD